MIALSNDCRYSVSAGVRRTLGVLGFCFTIASAKSSPLAVEERIEAFLLQWRNKLVHDQVCTQKRLIVYYKRWTLYIKTVDFVGLGDVPRLTGRIETPEGCYIEGRVRSALGWCEDYECWHSKRGIVYKRHTKTRNCVSKSRKNEKLCIKITQNEEFVFKMMNFCQ